MPQPSMPMQTQMPMPGLQQPGTMPMPGTNLAPPMTPVTPGMPMGNTMPRPMTQFAQPCGTTLPPPRPMMPMMDSMRPMGTVIPPPQGGMRPQMIPAPQQPFPSMPPRPGPPGPPVPLAPLAGQEAHRQAPPPAPYAGERKPQLFMLIAQLAPSVQDRFESRFEKEESWRIQDIGDLWWGVTRSWYTEAPYADVVIVPIWKFLKGV